MYNIGVDLGGTGIKVGVVDEKGSILGKVSAPTGVERGYEAVIADIAALCRSAVQAAGVDMAEVASIGIGIPGIMEQTTGIVPMCTNLGWHRVPLIAEMAKHIEKPVFVDNDATVAGLAESVAGISAGVQNSIFITLGTGVGGGIIVNGRVYTGPHGVASEVGHMITVAGGELCSCGNRGCWERYASATAIIREARRYCEKDPDCSIAKAVDGDLTKIAAKTVIDLAKDGDPVASELFRQYVYHICVGLVNLINLYDPEIIALGGGVSHAGDFLLDAVRVQLPEMVFFKDLPYARIELARLGNDAGIIGAAMLGQKQ